MKTVAGQVTPPRGLSQTDCPESSCVSFIVFVVVVLFNVFKQPNGCIGRLILCPGFSYKKKTLGMLAPEATASQRSPRCSVAYALKRRKEKKKSYVVVVALFNVFKRPNGCIGWPILCPGRPSYKEKH